MDKIILWLQNPKNQKVILGVSILVTSVLIFNMNYIFPAYLDDWEYSFIFGDPTSGRITNVMEIFRSQYNHYFMWGGRNVVHFIAQFMLMFPPVAQDVINSLGYMLLLLTIYQIANTANKINAFVFLFISILVFITSPYYFEIFIWITGAANYMWGPAIVLLFIYFVHSFYIKDKSTDNILKIIGMFILGILAGWTNENMGIAIIFYIIMVIIMMKYNKRKIPVWMIFGAFGVIIGCIVMLAAPGNFARLDQAKVQQISANSSFISSYIVGFDNVWMYFTHRLIVYDVFFFAILFLFVKFANHENKKRIMQMAILVFVTAHVAFFAMLVSPEFPKRALGPIISLLLTASCILYANVFTKKILYIINLAVLVVLIGVFAGLYIKYYHRAHKYYSVISEQRDKIVQEQKSKGIQDVILDEKYNLETDSSKWLNKVYSRFYGIRSIRVEEKDKLEKDTIK